MLLTMFAEFISKAVVEVAQLEVDVFLPHSGYQHPMERKKKTKKTKRVSSLVISTHFHQLPAL